MSFRLKNVPLKNGQILRLLWTKTAGLRRRAPATSSLLFLAFRLGDCQNCSVHKGLNVYT